MEILLDAFKVIPEAAISWLVEDSEFGDYAAMIELHHPLLQKGFCFVDGVNIPVAESEVDDIQNAYYNGWTCSHYCSNVPAFAPVGFFLIWCSVNGPGSWHDAAMARGLYDKLVNRTPEGYYAFADTTFPRNRADIEGRIKTPLKSTSKLPGQLQTQGRIREYRELMNFNTQLVSARQAAEWGMRAFQGSFGRLKLPLPANDHAHRHKVLMTCLRLHQVRTRCVGINQIKTVYEKIWRGGDPESVRAVRADDVQ
ncbi:hypothetical protein PF005_g7777 [Phytophthora fragariae]|nr:hypothetical protein PF009_g8581 [Phytophthora fragariae]KAE9096748.1 hypothetical protein PF010_g16227 [Phytophthora fragariae]KAE9120764.1 hypothetical protein PF007_g8046 [Phytophthora fragariae]KAE9219686.1 hypothetical protein PF005_g7777 [Phytophthora fragariae]KAE9241765.1 hypothetical protein PF004_g6909 [Phytophthora fragariae]